MKFFMSPNKKEAHDDVFFLKKKNKLLTFLKYKVNFVSEYNKFCGVCTFTGCHFYLSSAYYLKSSRGLYVIQQNSGPQRSFIS